MARSTAPDAKAELRRMVEGPLRFIVQRINSRGGKLRAKPLEGLKRVIACLELIKRRLHESGVDSSLTQPLQDILDAFAEADRGIAHPLFTPARLKGRPAATLAQWDVMWTAACAIDLYLASGQRRQDAARLVAKQLKGRGIEFNGTALIQWRHELTKAGRGQGLGRSNADWRWYGKAYLFQRDQWMRQLKEKTLNPEAQAARLLASL